MLGRAAEETGTKERSDMAKGKLTPAQLRAVRMRNLQKAWKSTGAKGREEVAEERGRRGRKASKPSKPRGHKRGKGRAREDWGVMEPKPKAKPAGGKKSPEQIRQERIGRLQAYRASKPVGAAAAPPAAAAAPKAGRTTAAGTTATHGKKRKSKVPPGRYMSPATGAIIQIQRVYPKENPTMSTYDAVGAGGGLLVGLVLSQMVDRGLATRAPEGKTEALYGMEATAALRTKADAVRVGAQLAGAVLFGAGSYFSRNYSSVASYTMGGTSAGFLVGFLLQIIGDYAMPAFFKASSPADKTFSNRYYADKQDWTQQGATPALPAAPPAGSTPASTTETSYPTGGTQMGWPGMVGTPMLLPPGAFQPRHRDYGPVASAVPAGSMAGAGGTFGGCGSCGDTSGNCPTCGTGCGGKCGCNLAQPGPWGASQPGTVPGETPVVPGGTPAQPGGTPEQPGTGTFVPGVGFMPVRPPPPRMEIAEPRPPIGVVAQPEGQPEGNVVDFERARRAFGRSYADLLKMRAAGGARQPQPK
jgi:hypothetical protein